jgi:hypothetical protein
MPRFLPRGIPEGCEGNLDETVRHDSPRTVAVVDPCRPAIRAGSDCIAN